MMMRAVDGQELEGEDCYWHLNSSILNASLRAQSFGLRSAFYHVRPSQQDQGSTDALYNLNGHGTWLVEKDAAEKRPIEWRQKNGLRGIEGQLRERLSDNICLKN